MGEIGLPPTDFYMMTRLPMRGNPPPYELVPSQEIVRRCLGPQPISYDRGFRRVFPSWFEKEYIWAMNESPGVEIDYSVRAFVLYIFTRSVFSGKSDQIFFNFLPPKVSTYGWGKSALGWMYSNMGEVANGEKLVFLGLHFLWKVWCYERLTTLTPCKKERDLFPVPCVERWMTSNTRPKAQRSISVFRRDLDQITATQVNWASWTAWGLSGDLTREFNYSRWPRTSQCLG